jgi:hypothetical protein
MVSSNAKWRGDASTTFGPMSTMTHQNGADESSVVELIQSVLVPAVILCKSAT